MSNPLFPTADDMPQDISIEVNGRFQDNITSFEPTKGQTLDRLDSLSVSEFFEGARLTLQTTAGGTALAKFTTLRTFFMTTIRQGAIKFDWKHPILQVVRQCKMKNFNYRSLGDENGPFEVTFDLEVMPT